MKIYQAGMSVLGATSSVKRLLEKRDKPAVKVEVSPICLLPRARVLVWPKLWSAVQSGIEGATSGRTRTMWISWIGSTHGYTTF